MLNLHIIVASTRPGRAGRSIADWFTDKAITHGAFDVTLVDLAEVDLPFLDEPEHPSLRHYAHQHTRLWSATIEAADALVFVMPEYNYGFNAPLKNAIDYLYEEWNYKPVGFVSYGMTSGGLRAVQMIKQVVTTLKMMPLTEAVSIPFVVDHLDKTGRFQPTALMNTSALGMLEELDRIATVFAGLRVSLDPVLVG